MQKILTENFDRKFFTVTEKSKNKNISLTYDVNGHVYHKFKSV